MTIAGSFSTETIDEARKLTESGLGRDALLTQFRVKWGLSQSDAERLYQQARRSAVTPSARAMKEEGTKDLLWGFGAFAVGGLITAITYLIAEPGGSYFLFWGPMIYGGYRLVKGFILKFKTTNNPQGVLVWLAIAVIMGSGIVVGGMVAYSASSVDAPPDTEFLWFDDDPQLISQDTILFSGEIGNANDKWSIKNPVLTINLYNESGLIVGERKAELNTGMIGPNQSKRYSTNVTVLESFESYEPIIEWDWVLE